jgi:hypothetical protein
MFTIVFTKRVVFKDLSGNVKKVYDVGSEVRATHDTGAYYITAMGGIWHDEAYKKL